MTEEKILSNEKDELLKKLGEIEHKLDSIKKGKLVDSEDQLFFGVIISFLILFVTLPMGDLITFLQTSFNLSEINASGIAQTVRYLGIILFLFSALTRYYAVVGNQLVSRKYRYASLEGVMFALASILAIISLNFISVLSAFLDRANAILITVITMLVIFAILNRAEIKILDFYSMKTITSRKYTFPFSSFMWVSFFVGIISANLVQLVAWLFGVSIQTLNTFFNSLWGISAMLFGFFYIWNWFGLKPSKDSDYYKWKTAIQRLIKKNKK